MGLIELSLYDRLRRLKANRDLDAVAGNLPIFDENGDLVDSGTDLSDYEPADATILKKSNVVDALDSSVSDVPLSANQGRVLKGTVDTNRLYSDSQYLDLKAKYEAQQIALNASKAELYTDDPILQYGAVEIIGDGYEADDTPIDVSANVVDGSLSMEQKGLTIRNLFVNGDFKNGFTSWGSASSTTPSVTNQIVSFTATAQYGRILQSIQNTNGNKFFISVRVKASSANVRLSCPTAGFSLAKPHSGSGEFEILTVLVTSSSALSIVQIQISDWGTSGWAEIQVDGTYGCRAYNLTAHGLDHITDTDILAQLLPYVDGTQNVGKMGVRVVGKNLCPPITWRQGDWNSPATAIRVSTDDRKILLRKGLTYAFSDNKTGYQVSFALLANPTDTALFGAITFSATPYTPTQDLWAVPVVKNTANTAFTPSELDGFIVQIEIGATPTAIEPYKAQLTFLPAIGNSLPNGTADSIKTVADGWEHTKRVSDLVTVPSNPSISLQLDSTYTRSWAWAPTPTMTPVGSTTVKNGKAIVMDTSGVVLREVPLTERESEASIGCYYTRNDANITFIFAKADSQATVQAAIAGYMIYFELAAPVTTHYDLPIPTSGKTIHRFAGEEKIALYGTGLTFSENVLTVLSAVKFVAGVMTDITSLATITGDTVTFSGVDATDVVYAQVEHDVDKPLGVLEHTPAVSNTASRLASLEARVSALEV